MAFAMVEGGMMAEALAWFVMFGEIEGGTWNWGLMDWEKDKD